MTWFDFAGNMEKRATVCEQHCSYVSNLAPVRDERCIEKA